MRYLLFLTLLCGSVAVADVTCYKRGSLSDYQCDQSVNVYARDMVESDAINNITTNNNNVTQKQEETPILKKVSNTVLHIFGF